MLVGHAIINHGLLCGMASSFSCRMYVNESPPVVRGSDGDVHAPLNMK